MAEVIRETTHTDGEHHYAHRGSSWVAWVALILSVLALLLAWMAYNRTGQDLETRIQQEVNRGIDTMQGQR
jgi:hypothetical protein